MHVILLSSDLMLTSSAQGVVQRCGDSLTTVATTDDAVAKCRELIADILVVDLRALSSTIDQVVSEVRGKLSGAAPQIVAVDQHVHEQRLAAARAAGCDAVFTRGEFDRRLDEFLRRANPTE